MLTRSSDAADRLLEAIRADEVPRHHSERSDLLLLDTDVHLRERSVNNLCVEAVGAVVSAHPHPALSLQCVVIPRYVRCVAVVAGRPSCPAGADGPRAVQLFREMGEAGFEAHRCANAVRGRPARPGIPMAILMMAIRAASTDISHML
jgi:hypothetical protein